MTTAYKELMELTTIEEGEAESQAEPTEHERNASTLRSLMIEMGPTFCWENYYEGQPADTWRPLTDEDLDCIAYDPDRDTADRNTIQWMWRMLHGLNREELTEVALAQSLCPIHFVDYAICFDDQDPLCHSVRLIHPSHDT